MQELRAGGTHFALRVRGDSMIDDGIMDGDIVIIREQPTADDGQTVVAMIDETHATLKKIYREKNRIRLQPANQRLRAIYRTDVLVRGVVVKIIRQLEKLAAPATRLQSVITTFPLTPHARRPAAARTTGKARPFLQWAGGKRGLLPQYQVHLPRNFKTYFEPFLGGGALFFHLQPPTAVLADNNPELMTAYTGVRDHPAAVIALLNALKARHSSALYTALRQLDRNPTFFETITPAEVAARLIYLNQTCFNGVYRVNKKGQFNVPIGSSLNRLICDADAIRRASQALRHATLLTADFEQAVAPAGRGDFIYLDPPYYPVSKYSDFTRYTKEKFYEADQVRLKHQVDRLSKRGCRIMLSNSNCPFIRDLYRDYRQHQVLSSRLLNAKKERRGKIAELLITNY